MSESGSDDSGPIAYSSFLQRFISLDLSIMKKSFTLLLAVVFALLLAVPQVQAQEEGEQEGQVDAVHHIADAHYLDFTPIAEVSLPRLFLVQRPEGLGIDVFSSTDAAVASGRYHMTGGGAHGAAEAEGGEEAETPHIVMDDGEIIFDFSITKHVVYQLLVAVLLMVMLIKLARSYRRGAGRKTAPRGRWKNMWEVMVTYIRDEVAKPNLGHHYKKYLPYLLSVFFFILFANLIGLIPFGATATANITVTATLAGFTFVMTQMAGTKEHWQHIFWPPGPLLIKPLMIPVEILGLFTKPFALAIRLFANMVAGHMVLLNIIGLIFLFTAGFGVAAGWAATVFSVMFSLFIYALELLVAFIQAYVFTILSALFIGMAIVEHHEDEHAYDDAGSLGSSGPETSQLSGDGMQPETSSMEPAVAGRS